MPPRAALWVQGLRFRDSRFGYRYRPSPRTWDSGLRFRITISRLRISIQSTCVPVRKPVWKCRNQKSVWKCSLLVQKLTDSKFVIWKSKSGINPESHVFLLLLLSKDRLYLHTTKRANTSRSASPISRTSHQSSIEHRYRRYHTRPHRYHQYRTNKHP